MIRFRTSSGSEYELDTDNDRIRRLSGTAKATARQGPDNVWKDFEAIHGPDLEFPCLIVWEGVKCTLTSDVVKIYD